jgi:23S rRNA pseudouridine2605 synthase
MSPEKRPRQPRKPFQNAGKKERSPEPDKRRAGGRSEGRMDKPFRPKPPEERSAKPYVKRDKPFSQKDGEDRPKRAFKKERPYPSREEGDRPPKRDFKKPRPYTAREEGDRPPKKVFKKPGSFTPREGGDRPERRERPERPERPSKRIIRREGSEGGEDRGFVKKYATRSGVRIKGSAPVPEGIRLNKFIANSGICSRREADELIKAGVIKVNGEVISTLGAKVMPTDKVQYGDQTLNNEKRRYLLLNKQKGYVTTTKDPHAKNTVMDLIAGACKERIYPVGRLDRNTTGLLLFTNDGEIAKKLMHPRSRVKKLYHVFVDQPVSKNDMIKIAGGINLEGETVQVDSIEYVEDAADRREIGIEIHSGQNRVIRRIFESLGYKVTKLDRVLYAGLTKKNLPRGRWRFLTEQEVISLIMLK